MTKRATTIVVILAAVKEKQKIIKPKWKNRKYSPHGKKSPRIEVGETPSVHIIDHII